MQSLPPSTPGSVPICLGNFSARGVKEQDEGPWGTSDPQLWLLLWHRGPIFGRTPSEHNTLSPVWPEDSSFCFVPDDSEEQRICFDIRDDDAANTVLNYGCTPLPLPMGPHMVPLAPNDCNSNCLDANVSFVVVRPLPPAHPPPPLTPHPEPPAPLQPPWQWIAGRDDIIPVCPKHMHLCMPNDRQDEVFCDNDQDCWGDNFCSETPACAGPQDHCCVQAPTAANKTEQPDWVEPRAFNEQLSPRVCSILLRDRSHLFRRMWGTSSREQNHKGDNACWSRNRWATWETQPADEYFNDILTGKYCEKTDWYEGFASAHGWFSRSAPALLGFDPDITGYCNNNCDGTNVNILAIFSSKTPYNMCRNFEWQMCAVLGKLPWQADRELVFARAPNTVYLDGYPPFGRCSGYTSSACSDTVGFANDDIFYLEVCLFSQVCSNAAEMFDLDVGDRWVCQLGHAGFDRLKGWLLEGADF